jgi:hypothetical protein
MVSTNSIVTAGLYQPMVLKVDRTTLKNHILKKKETNIDILFLLLKRIKMLKIRFLEFLVHQHNKKLFQQKKNN